MIHVSLPNDFTPRFYQEPPMRYLDAGGKRVMWVVHRRAGKDLTWIHQTAKMAHQRIGSYWHLYPSFSQARRAIWDGFTKDGKRILENAFPGFLDPKRPGSIVKKKDDQQMVVEFKCGSMWRLIGSDRIEVVGAGPVGVVYSEYAMSDPRARNLIQPMLRENGGWEAYITTPRGRNHAKDLFDIAVKDPTWFVALLRLQDTEAWREWTGKDGSPYTSAQAVFDDARQEGMPDALIKQEYECDWSAALVGSVFGDLVDELDKRGLIAEFDHAKDDVFTTWDLGFTDSTAIWFWRAGNEGIEIIDHHEAHGKPLSYYYGIVDAKPYRYIKHWLPHDARQTTLSSGVSILNQMLKQWPGQVACGPELPLLDGIQAGRWLLQQNVRIHGRCHEGVNALRDYHYEYDEEKKTFGTRPAHTWASHTADAFRYLSAVVKHSQLLAKGAQEKRIPVVQKPIAAPHDRRYTLDQLFADRDQAMARRRRI